MAYAVHHIEGRAVRHDGGGPLVVWNARHCPFAQRLVIALAFKDIPHERRDISLIDLYKNKPKDFLEVNPLGQVPGINDNGKHVRESLVCVEYVDDVWSNPESGSILPTDPYEKALSRLIVEDFGREFVPSFFAAQSSSGAAQDEKKQKCLDALKSFSGKLSRLSEGPFAFGNRFGYVEVALASFVQRLCLLKHDGNFVVPDDESYARFHQWWQAVEGHPAFVASAQTTEFLVEARATFAQLHSKPN